MLATSPSSVFLARVRQSPRLVSDEGGPSRYHADLTDWGGGAGGTRTPDPLHAMQVLSQLSYNPTIGPLIGAAIGRHPGRCWRLLGGRGRGLCDRRLAPSRLAADRGGRLLFPRQRVRAEYISRAWTLHLEVLQAFRSQTKVTPGRTGGSFVREVAPPIVAACPARPRAVAAESAPSRWSPPQTKVTSRTPLPRLHRCPPGCRRYPARACRLGHRHSTSTSEASAALRRGRASGSRAHGGPWHRLPNR